MHAIVRRGTFNCTWYSSDGTAANAPSSDADVTFLYIIFSGLFGDFFFWLRVGRATTLSIRFLEIADPLADPT